jgi:hypothetical protein
LNLRASDSSSEARREQTDFVYIRLVASNAKDMMRSKTAVKQ